MGLGIKIRSYETRGRIFAHQCWKPPATFTKIYSQQRGPESARMALETHVCVFGQMTTDALREALTLAK